MTISMTHYGEPGENAGPDADIVCWSIAERVNGTIKNEFYCRGFLSFQLAQERIQQAITAYNYLRPHASCDYLTPEQAHNTEGLLKKRWSMNNTKKVIVNHVNLN
jgi:hypothetical protein